MKDEASSELALIVKRLNLVGYRRHIFLCAGPKCCLAEQGEILWAHLKSRCKELELVNFSVFRTKALCLRICRNGPIAVVYPEGTWYSDLNAKKLDRVISEHLIQGRVVKDYVLAENESG